MITQKQFNEIEQLVTLDPTTLAKCIGGQIIVGGPAVPIAVDSAIKATQIVGGLSLGFGLGSVFGQIGSRLAILDPPPREP